MGQMRIMGKNKDRFHSETYFEISILTNIELSAADVTGDKEVSIFDILEMQRYILRIADF